MLLPITCHPIGKPCSLSFSFALFLFLSLSLSIQIIHTIQEPKCVYEPCTLCVRKFVGGKTNSTRHTTRKRTRDTHTDMCMMASCLLLLLLLLLLLRGKQCIGATAKASQFMFIWCIHLLIHLEYFRYWYLRRAAVSISLYFQLGCCFSSMNMDRKFVAIYQSSKKTEIRFRMLV